MDRYLTFEGEQPIWLDDFNFMQDAIKDSLCKVVQTIMRSDEQTCILNGCEVTYDNNTASWTDGIVMLDGELLPVKAGTVKETDPNRELMLYFQIIETSDPNGVRTFKNGDRHNCYQRRHATITTGNDGFYIDEIPRLEDLASEKSYQIYSSYTNVDNYVRAELLHPFGGGWYIRGTIKLHSPSPSAVRTVIPKSDVSKFTQKGLRTGSTYSLMTLFDSRYNKRYVEHITIDVKDENDSRYLSVDLSESIQLQDIEGQFYCRLID